MDSIQKYHHSIDIWKYVCIESTIYTSAQVVLISACVGGNSRKVLVRRLLFAGGAGLPFRFLMQRGGLKGTVLLAHNPEKNVFFEALIFRIIFDPTDFHRTLVCKVNGWRHAVKSGVLMEENAELLRR